MAMKITRGNVYLNKTKRYLAPILQDVDFPKFLKLYLKDNHVGFFRGDIEYNDVMSNNKYLLFVIVDINGEWVDRLNQYKSIEVGRRNYRAFMRNWRKKKVGGYKVYDYVIGDLSKSHYHIFVLDISNYAKAVDAFDLGKYSKMFNDNELKKLRITKTINGKLSNLYATFKKLPAAKKLFQERIEDEFGTILKDSDLKNVDEYDVPPNQKYELLNISKVS